MKTYRRFNTLKWLAFPAYAGLLTAAVSAFGQSTAATTGKPDEKKKEDEIVKLSPFQVSGTGDSGYFKKNTMVGTRSSELIVNIPQNIQIVTSDLIRDIPTDTTAEVLKFGASGINQRTPKIGDIFMRGFRVRGFLKDNVPYGGNINVPLYDVDRIEVVKGPAALVFGQSSATGGQVNYVTKAPTETPRSSAKATIGSYDFKRLEANTSGPLGLTGLSYRGTFATTDAGGPRKFDYNKDLFLGTTLLYKLSGTSSVQFDYSFSKKDEIVGQTGTDTTLKLAQVPDDFSYFEPWVYGRSYYQFATLTYRAAITPSFQLQLVANFN